MDHEYHPMLRFFSSIWSDPGCHVEVVMAQRQVWPIFGLPLLQKLNSPSRLLQDEPGIHPGSGEIAFLFLLFGIHVQQRSASPEWPIVGTAQDIIPVHRVYTMDFCVWRCRRLLYPSHIIRTLRCFPFLLTRWWWKVVSIRFNRTVQTPSCNRMIRNLRKISKSMYKVDGCSVFHWSNMEGIGLEEPWRSRLPFSSQQKKLYMLILIKSLTCKSKSSVREKNLGII